MIIQHKNEMYQFLRSPHSHDEWRDYCESFLPSSAGALYRKACADGFVESPASTKYHGAGRGGLVKHSLCVLLELDTLLEAWEIRGDEIWENDARVAAIFHDLCKVGLYKEEIRWRKDENGKWESYFAYGVNDNKIQIGHGAESLRLIEKGRSFSHEEWAMAVNYHMGMPENWIEKQQYMKAVEKYPVILALHTADMMASVVRGF
jgi:hypothetical protein